MEEEIAGLGEKAEQELVILTAKSLPKGLVIKDVKFLIPSQSQENGAIIMKEMFVPGIFKDYKKREDGEE